MENLVKEVLVRGKDVFVAVSAPSVKEFKKVLLEEHGPRKNKRFDPERSAYWLVRNFVHAKPEFKGKHVKVHLVSATDKPGLFRDEKGHFTKLENLKAEAKQEAKATEPAEVKEQVEVTKTAEVQEPAEA